MPISRLKQLSIILESGLPEGIKGFAQLTALGVYIQLRNKTRQIGKIVSLLNTERARINPFQQTITRTLKELSSAQEN